MSERTLYYDDGTSESSAIRSNYNGLQFAKFRKVLAFDFCLQWYIKIDTLLYRTMWETKIKKSIKISNPLTPNDHYRGRTAPLTSKRCILYIYSTNIGTEYFKHDINSPFFLSKCSLCHNSNLFGSCIIHILYTGCAKIKKK